MNEIYNCSCNSHGIEALTMIDAPISHQVQPRASAFSWSSRPFARNPYHLLTASFRTLSPVWQPASISPFLASLPAYGSVQRSSHDPQPLAFSWSLLLVVWSTLGLTDADSSAFALGSLQQQVPLRSCLNHIHRGSIKCSWSALPLNFRWSYWALSLKAFFAAFVDC